MEISRREFCAFAASIAGAATVALAGCTAGGSAIQTGQLTGSDGDQPDANVPPADGSQPRDASEPHDAGTEHDAPHAIDAASGATCPGSGATDVGAPSSFTASAPTYISAAKIFVCRDSGGLYAMTAKCTHEGATCEVQGSYIFCPRHGAEFSFDGDVEQGPATRPLAHYAMCTLANGHVGVITSMTVPESQRLNA